MEDYFAFSEVCIEWQYAVLEKLQHLRSNHKRHCRLHQQVPLLMAPIPTANNPGDGLRLYDVMKKKILCQVQLGQGRWMCEGSSHGWLILVDKDSYKVTLFNPFSEKLIHLPPLEKEIYAEFGGRVYKRIFPSTPRRGVLSNDPQDEFVLMMTCSSVSTGSSGRKETTAFIKSGEEDWTYIKKLRNVKDIVYSNGLFYLLSGSGLLFSCDMTNGFKMRRIASADNQSTRDSYLVESPDGDLLRVIKHEGEFEIYKLLWFSKNARWEKIISLGKVALFLGDNHSISVIASDFAGCRGNSIYFCQRTSSIGSLDGSVYVFSLDKRISRPLYPRSQQPLLWISPKLV